MSELNKLRLEGKKLIVSVRDDGGIIPGPNTNKLMSFMGFLVKFHVPITYAKWKEVDKQLKDHLWEELNVRNFVISITY